MSIWWTIPGFVGLVGLLLVFGGLGRLLKLQLVGGAFRFLFGGVVLAGAAVVALVGLNLQTYARLTHEQLAAELTLKQTGPGEYVASVAKADEAGQLRPPRDYAVTGDQVRIEADEVVFQPWANIVGADALYRFNRVQGRFDSEAAEQAAPPKPWSMREPVGIDLFSLPLGSANPLKHVDADFLGAVAAPMADGAVYEIHMSQKGMIIRPKNEAATKAVEAHRAKLASMPTESAPASSPIQLAPAPSGAGASPSTPSSSASAPVPNFAPPSGAPATPPPR